MKKLFILDTNVLLTDPNSIFQFASHDVVIPIIVIEELDLFKKELSMRGSNARKVSRLLDKLSKLGDLRSGIPIQHALRASAAKSSTLALDSKNHQQLKNTKSKEQNTADKELAQLWVHLPREPLPNGLGDTCDHRILAIALKLAREYQGQRKVVLVTCDVNLRVKSEIYGITAEDFAAPKLGSLVHEEGMGRIMLTEEQAEELRRDHRLQLPDHTGYSNEFFLIGVAQSSEVDSVNHDPWLGIFQNGYLKTLGSGDENIWGVSARNLEQRCALSALLDDRIRLVTMTGKAGTGKTLLAVAAGLYKTTDEDVYSKLLVSRPIFPMGKDIGYLPGDIEQKINPWMQPIYDSLDFLLSGGR
ncbi:MAG: PIN domain-containing protein, partial [Proteobacteria bacterium]|nr:PIN domain-containing protein [Pseudomonadota bacterium]